MSNQNQLDGMPEPLNDVTITITGKIAGFIPKLPETGHTYDDINVTQMVVHSVEKFAPDEHGHTRHTVKLKATLQLRDDT